MLAFYYRNQFMMTKNAVSKPLGAAVPELQLTQELTQEKGMSSDLLV